MLPLPISRRGDSGGQSPRSSHEESLQHENTSWDCSSSTSSVPGSPVSGGADLQQDSTHGRHSQVVRARWSAESSILADVENWDLPCLARIKPGYKLRIADSNCNLLPQSHYRSSTSLAGQPDTGGVSNTPLLLYAMQKCSKVRCTMLRKEAGQLSEYGPRLIIPINYPGWFQFADERDSEVHKLDTIGEVARAEYREFIVHRPVTGYRYAKRSENGNKLYCKHTVKAGDVLTIRNVLTEWLSDESINQSGCSCFGKAKPKHEPSFLKCRDTSGRRLILPFDTAGEFSEVGQRGAEPKKHASYQLTDIARLAQLPANLKLVCGDTPAGLEFSGLIRVDEVFFERTVVACTTGVRKEHGHQLLEFPVDVDLTLTRCKNWTELESTDAVESAILHSEENFNAFVADIKVVNDDHNGQLTETDAMVSQIRALPPTPQLPRIAKPRRSRAWMWAKSLISHHKRNSKHNDSASEDSDYEVIPFYLRTVGSRESVDTDIDEDTVCSRKDQIVHDNASFDCEDIVDCPSNDECRTTPSTPASARMPSNDSDTQHNDTAHDEDGYLLPVEFRESLKIKAADVSSCTLMSDKTDQAAMSTSYHSSAQDTSSSATVTRCTDGTACSLNKSTETLLAPPSSGTMRSYINSVAESEYCPTKFDQQRLDAFLVDSIHELQRRQSKEILMDRNPLVSGQERREIVPTLENKSDVTTFLDKIFDCDRDDKEAESQSSGVATYIPLTTRSMSVPEAILSRSLDPRLFRSGGEFGYQTLDSGIWLSPRSAISDPYRHERDSATYRSTSDCSWVPPEQISPLTVEEVGLSLRYIGMKEHIVTRFCEEQIDGKQLTELNEQLLLEGFPDLNALDRKKLIDFIQGWRPKKWGYIPVE